MRKIDSIVLIALWAGLAISLVGISLTIGAPPQPGALPIWSIWVAIFGALAWALYGYIFLALRSTPVDDEPAPEAISAEEQTGREWWDKQTGGW